MRPFRFIFRQIDNSRKQSFIFIICVALSLLILVSLGSFSGNVRKSLLKDARQLHAADIIVTSHYPFSPPLMTRITDLERQGVVQGALVHEFYSMATNPVQHKSVLSHLKVAEKDYPFYGEVKLASGRAFADTLAPGSIVVEQGVLDRLQAKIGDQLKIGSAHLQIADIVFHEPDRPVSFFSFGPRIFVAAEDLQKLDLIKQGSRIHYKYLLKVADDSLVDPLAEELAATGIKRQENVKTFQTAESGIKRFFDNFLFFLNLIGIFTLLLAGIGIQTSLSALLRESEHTIAIMKSVGATSRYITRHYIGMIMVLGAAGTVLGLVVSSLLQLYFPSLFSGVLPANVSLTIAWDTVFEGILLGAIVVILFSVLPFRGLKNIKPAFIFKKESNLSGAGLVQVGTVAIIILFFSGLTIWQLEDVTTGLSFVAALLVLIGLTALICNFLLFVMKKKMPQSLAMRQAFRGLFRPQNATRAIIITLSASLAVIFSISLIEKNLQTTFIDTYPPNLPNVYFLDIQPAQQQDFAAIINDENSLLYPIIRARLSSINDRPIIREQELKKRRDNLAREFNLTYRDYLLDDERLVQGKTLFGSLDAGSLASDEVAVSVLDTVAELGDIDMGDLLTFKVQGIPLKARVTSFRTRTASKVRPFFYYVFPSKVLEDAPQTLFCAVRMNSAKLTLVQEQLSSQLPNISVIDIGATVKILATIMHKLSNIIRFFTAFSIIAGLLIIVSSILATRLARTREAVYFKILGGTSSFVLQVFTFENLLIGLICSLLAALMSQAGSWIVCRQVLNVPYRAFWGSSLLMIAMTVGLVIAVGLAASYTVLQQRPANFLRDEGEE